MPVYDDQKTDVSDEELRKITGITEAEEKTWEGDASKDIEKREESGASEQTTKADQEEASSLNDNGFYNPKKDKGPSFRDRLNNVSKKKVGFITAIISTIIVSIVGLFSFLMPFKITNIVESIENKVGNVPEYAVNQRLEFYMNRFLIMRAMEGSGIDIKDSQYTYLGEGVMGTLYTNWRGAKLDVKLAERGYRIKPVVNDAQLLGRRYSSPSNWILEDLNVGSGSALRERSLSSKEARAFIKEFAKAETKSPQVIKRFHMRRILKKYYGVNDWKPFEKTRGDVRDKYLEKKKKLYKYMVDKSVGKVSEKYGAYLNCILDGGDACKEIRRGETSDNTASNTCGGATKDGQCPDEENGSKSAHETDANALDDMADEAGKIAEETLDEEASKGFSAATEKILGEKISKKIQELGLKKVLSSFVAGIGVIETISQVQKSLDSGALNIVLYDKNATQYASYAAPVLSMADQIRSGEDFDPEDLRAVSEMFGNYSQSPVFQGFYGKLSGSPIARDCNGNGNTTDPEDQLEPGETVCPDKRLVQDKTSFTNTDGWRAFSAVMEKYRSTVGAVVGAITGVINKAFEVTHINDAITAAFQAIGLDKALSAGFGWLMNRVFGVAVTGTETSGAAYEATAAGISVRNASLGGGVGTHREDTIGGGYLTNAQVGMIQADQQAEYLKELQQQPFFARYFSPNVSDSLTANLAMSLPTSIVSTSSSIIGTLSPQNLFHTVGSMFTPHAKADTSVNPFHVINYGYPADDPVLTMEPDELKTTYKCDLPPDQRPQNQDAAYKKVDGLPFPVATTSDPCLLEEAVKDAGERYFTGTYNEGIDGASSASSPTNANNANIFMIGDSYSVGMKSFGGLEQKLKGWTPTIDAACGRPLAGTDMFSGCSQPPAYKGLGAVDQPANQTAIKNAGTVIVELGTNDLGGDPNGFRANVKQMISKIKALNGTARIFWVNLYVENDKKASAIAYNKVLAEESAASGFTVIDWFSKAPQYYVTGDKLHPNDYNAISEFIVNSLGAPPGGTAFETQLQPEHQGFTDKFANFFQGIGKTVREWMP